MITTNILLGPIVGAQKTTAETPIHRTMDLAQTALAQPGVAATQATV